MLNNPLSLTDPSGEFFWFAVALGAVFGGASAAMQGGNFWDILGGALIGGIAAGIGAGLGNLAAQGLGFAGTAGGFFGNAALSVSGFGAGFTVGFVGGFAGGFVGTTGNALMKGQKLGKSLLMGLKAGFFSGVAAGVTAGVSAGIKASKNNGDFWTGDGATYDMLAPPGTTTEVAQDLEYSNDFAKDFSDKHFGNMENLDKLYADGTFPEGYSLKGDHVFNSKGQEILAVTKPMGKNCYNVYLSKAAFSSKEQLYLTMQHEYLHVNIYAAGLRGGKKHHASIYKWQSQQARAWGFRADYYESVSNMFSQYHDKSYDKFLPNILKQKPW